MIKLKSTKSAANQDSAVAIGPSFVGTGVYSCREFKRGDTIGEVLGEYHLGDGEYAIEIDHQYSLEPDAPFRFLNHCCRPNAELFTDTRKNGPHLRMFLAAVRKIRLGEEITIAYGWTAKDAIPCECGSEKCLGWVVDPEELHLVNPQQRKKPRTAAK